MSEKQEGLGLVFGEPEGFFCENDENKNLADLQQICGALVRYCKIEPRRVLLASMMGAYQLMSKNNEEVVEELKKMIEDQKKNIKYINFQCENEGNTLIEKIGALMELPEETQTYRMVNFVAKELMKQNKEEDKNE